MVNHVQRAVYNPHANHFFLSIPNTSWHILCKRERLKIPIPKRSHPTNTLLNYLCNRLSNETQKQGKKSEAQENKIA